MKIHPYYNETDFNDYRKSWKYIIILSYVGFGVIPMIFAIGSYLTGQMKFYDCVSISEVAIFMATFISIISSIFNGSIFYIGMPAATTLTKQYKVDRAYVSKKYNESFLTEVKLMIPEFNEPLITIVDTSVHPLKTILNVEVTGMFTKNKLAKVIYGYKVKIL